MAYQSVQKPTLMTDVPAILDHVCDGVLIWIQTFKPIPYKNIQLFHYTCVEIDTYYIYAFIVVTYYKFFVNLEALLH
jgi:hypothetical protein